MTRSLKRLALAGAVAAIFAAVPQNGSAEEAYSTPGHLFGGVDTGVVVPLNALNRFTGVGGFIAPFVGYKLFQDKELQLNPAMVGSLQFLGLPPQCQTCQRPGSTPSNSIHDNPTYALSFQAGPRLSVPWGPIEIYGDFQIGGLTGLASGASITDTSWGFMPGGGINYWLTRAGNPVDIGIGLVGRWQRWYQRVHGVGDVRFATAGLEVVLQEAPPPPPPPPAPVAAPPPPPAPPGKKKIVLRGVNFDFDKYNIRSDAVPILEQACSILKQESTINVVAQGYTDSIGTEAYNQKLSERRANAVRDWLVKCGIPTSRLSSKGFGESNPVASNATPEGRAQNRRTELVVVP
jgi:outer membrane protein OmpA-like peptidoglycan-associated protein